MIQKPLSDYDFNANTPKQKQQVQESANLFQNIDNIKESTRPILPRSTDVTVDQSLFRDMVDIVMLEGIGQTAERIAEVVNEGRVGAFDPNYNPFGEIKGYEHHADQFTESANPIETQRIKDRIDRNQQRRDNISDAGIGTYLASAFINPITAIPIFGIRHNAFFANFGRAAYQVGGAEGVSQYVASKLDPTKPEGEGIMMTGSAALFGGLLTGTIARLTGEEPDAFKRYFGKNVKQYIDDYNRAFEEANVKLSPAGTKFYFDSTSLKNGIIFVKDGTNKIFYNNKKSVTAKHKEAKVEVKGNAKQFDDVSNIYTKEQLTQIKNNLADTPNAQMPLLHRTVAEFNEKNNQITFDDVGIKQKWLSQAYKEEFKDLKLNIPIAKMFKTMDDYMHFEFIKAIARKIYVKPEKFASKIEHEKAVNKWAVEYSVRPENAYLRTDINGFLRTLEKVSPLRRGLEKVFKNKILTEKQKLQYMEDLYQISGNHATQTQLNKMGRASPTSIATDLSLKHFGFYIQTIAKVEDDFHKLMGGNATQTNWQRRKQGFRVAMENTFGNARNAILGRTKRMSKQEYFELVGEARADKDILVHFDPQTRKAVNNSLKQVDNFFKYYNEQNSLLGLYANQNTMKRTLLRLESAIEKIDRNVAQIPVGDPRVNALLARKKKLQRDVKSMNNELREFDEDTSLIKDYMPIIWRLDKVNDQAEQLKGLIRQKLSQPNKGIPHSSGHPKYISIRDNLRQLSYAKEYGISMKKSDKIPPNERDLIIEAETARRFDDIRNEQASFMNIDNSNGIDKTYRGRGKIGAKQLLERDTLLPISEIKEFIETDINFIMRSYAQKIGASIEFTRRFGDVHMRDYIINKEIDMISQGISATERNTILNAYIDEKDKLLGTFFTGDPASMSVRATKLLENVIHLAYMGKVTISGLPELARPIMVDGFMKTYFNGFSKDAVSRGLNPFAKSNMADVHYLNPLMELAMSMTNRYVWQGGIHLDATRSGNILDKYIGRHAERAQEYFYTFNGLQPMTYFLKTFNGLLSAHRFLEDSVAWSKGKLDVQGQQRMLSYGIDENNAKLIASMPIEAVEKGGGMHYLANVREWDKIAGGKTAREIFAQALRTDVDRRIVTPTTADVPNMMSGVVRINYEGARQLFNNNLFRKFANTIGLPLGAKFDATEFGVKINIAPIQLLTQFFSWMMGANGKVFLSAAQGREKGLVTMNGIMSMIALGVAADFLKNPSYWENKNWTERVIRGVELSGVTGLLGDLNFHIETLSQGAFETPLGLRPLLGQDPRFGNVSGEDAFKSVAGAGPAAVYDLISVLSDNRFTEEEKHDTIKRLLPGSTLLGIEHMIDYIYDTITGIKE